MPVDPTAVIVAVATALGGLVQGADIPAPVKEQAAQAIQSVQASSPQAGQQISDVIGQLPQQMQEPARQAVADAATAVQTAVQPYLPPPPPPAVPDPVLPPAPVITPPAPAAPRVTATSDNGDDSDNSIPFGGDLSRTVTSLDAAFPGANLAPIGAIGVFVPWLQKAGQICEGVKAPVIAALYNAENGFRFGPTAPVSRTGALGPGQFMPGTWAKYGKDADGDGKADVLGVADPVMASGHLLCDMYAQIDDWKKQGLVKGDTLDLTIAGYNAGVDAVRRAGGMPSGSFDYEHQTKPYVAKIRASEPVFAAILAPFNGDGTIGSKVVEAALRYLGLPYVWGGGNINGPSGGGFDCSGLTSYAVYSATGDTLALPRTSETQWNIGTEIPMSEARPGDLLFGNWQSGGPGHVAIYIGNGQMVHAPQTGDVVKVGPVFDGMKVRRIV
ncbi:lytic transglycosylase [Rhodococcus spelaei]|uniref:Lytic transglycosylase n=1 Tax=Rhodococcus spelaei TaxID=2546320 RepID=A0A541BNL9_9NOCA|nr:bifunctional lytic transglycosylase/C40 family peptidase [Rhodococcus spelaei]TQF73921.1 lytic transglycosylase [Rhodococcus spelaei]